MAERITWKRMATIYPQYYRFVQWVVQQYGSCPDGEVTEEDYNRLRAAYEERNVETSERRLGDRRIR